MYLHVTNINFSKGDIVLPSKHLPQGPAYWQSGKNYTYVIDTEYDLEGNDLGNVFRYGYEDKDFDFEKYDATATSEARALSSAFYYGFHPVFNRKEYCEGSLADYYDTSSIEIAYLGEPDVDAFFEEGFEEEVSEEVFQNMSESEQEAYSMRFEKHIAKRQKLCYDNLVDKKDLVKEFRGYNVYVVEPTGGSLVEKDPQGAHESNMRIKGKLRILDAAILDGVPVMPLDIPESNIRLPKLNESLREAWLKHPTNNTAVTILKTKARKTAKSPNVEKTLNI